MSEDRSKTRPAPITYRPPKALQAELHARQRRSGLSMNAFITEAIFGATAPRQYRRPPIEKTELARLLGYAADIHDRLDTLIADDGCGEDGAVMGAVMEELATIRAALIRALGRSP